MSRLRTRSSDEEVAFSGTGAACLGPRRAKADSASLGSPESRGADRSKQKGAPGFGGAKSIKCNAARTSAPGKPLSAAKRASSMIASGACPRASARSSEMTLGRPPGLEPVLLARGVPASLLLAALERPFSPARFHLCRFLSFQKVRHFGHTVTMAGVGRHTSQTAPKRDFVNYVSDIHFIFHLL